MLEEFLTPCQIVKDYKSYQIGYSISTYMTEFPDLDSAKVAIVGIDDNRPDYDMVSSSADEFRKEFYKLSIGGLGENELVDLGNISPGVSLNDTRRAVEEITKTLVEMSIIPLFIGGNRGFCEPVYHGLGKVKSNIDFTYLSSHLPLLENEFLHRICTSDPNYLLNLNVIGFQRHFIPRKSLDTLENLGFNHLRLGALKGKVEKAEPLIRNTDMFMVDLSVMAQHFAPANPEASISGIDSDMACQLSWYAGVSDTSKCFGIFEFHPHLDNDWITAQLVAQMAWYYIDGISNRKEDHPSLHDEFYRYRCNLALNSPDILFFKSKRTDRWWMELPGRSAISPSFDAVVPCSYEDYQTATYGDLPERYLKALQHLN